MATDALFVDADDGRWLPTDAARGPWTPDALHGGPVAALLAGEAEAVGTAAAPGPMHPARLTVELLRPVPLLPLTLRAEVIRPGRKVQLVAAVLDGPDGVPLATATLLQIRTAEVAVPVSGLVSAQPPPPGGGRPLEEEIRYPAFHNHGVEHRFISGYLYEPGPAVDWIRLRVPVVAGSEPTPLQRVAAAADFGNGISSVAGFTELLFVNPDLTVYLSRLPAGEWVCLDAATKTETHGVALADSALFDERGPIGRSLQALLLEQR